jgi:histone deacetylase 6
VPFPDQGMGDADYIYAFQQLVMPIAYEFKPDFVIGSSPVSSHDSSLTCRAVSAGYDAADGDTLGQMKVSPEGFAHMTHMLSVLANGKLVLALEVSISSSSLTPVLTTM